MKLTSSRKALNPAFKRFQYLPQLRPGKPSNPGSELPALVAPPMEGEGQRAAVLPNVSVEASNNTQPFSAQTCE